MTGNVFVVQGDALRLPLPDRSIDAVICDPPYSLSFMGRQWDSFGGPQAFQAWCQQWATEALRVLRPGGWLLAFGGTRTWHRLACGLEDAGFEMRDTIAEFGPGGDATEASYGPLAWVYGSGFPLSKSLDVGKAIDKMAPRRGMFADFARHYEDRRKATGLTHAQVCEVGHFYNQVNHGGASVNWERGHGVPTLAQWPVLRDLLGLSGEWLPLIERVEAEREVVGRTVGAGNGSVVGLGSPRSMASEYDLTAPATPEAERWQGWGTALKPSWEPIIVARKPLAGNVAQNVLTYGTGALNIDAARIEGVVQAGARTLHTFHGGEDGYQRGTGRAYQTQGRWPPNVALIHSAGCQPTGTRKIRPNGSDIASPRSGGIGGGMFGDGEPDNIGGGYADWTCDPDCPVALLDHQSGERPSGSRAPGVRKGMGYHGANGDGGPAIIGGSSRFFYTAKAGPNERVTIDGEGHPTVKPLALMRWLVRLVTPPGGLILDMFAGSGTTGEAAMLEGFRAVLIDKDPANLPSIRVRTHPYVRRTKIITNGSQIGPEQGSLL